MSPASGVDPTIIAELRTSLRERERQEDRIINSIEDIGERLSKLEGTVTATQARLENVAKGVHDLRNDLVEKGVFKPEIQRAENTRLMRDIVDERLGLWTKQMADEQRKRDDALLRLLKVVATVGGAVAVAASWMAERWDKVGALFHAFVGLLRGGE